MKTLLPYVVLFALAGCAGPATPAAQPAAQPADPPAATATPLPTLTPPSEPPSGFTDDSDPKGVVVGTVTRGGTGPCYGLTTDDGVEYAVYNGGSREFLEGTRVRMQTIPSRLRINCGTGRFVEATSIELLR